MKSIFITGAASGIGLATARHFAAQGWYVGLYDINQTQIETLLAGNEFPRSCGGHCDVTSRESIAAALVEFTGNTDGQLQVLVNNAGVLSAGNFANIDPDDHDLMMDVNVKGFTHVAQVGFPYLRDTPGACMINLCSASSIHGVPGLAVYSASKYFVNAMTQALHIEWAEHDIRVTCVKPALVSTQMGNTVQANVTSAMTIDLAPEDIAVAIDKAIHGKRVSYVVGATARIWAVLDKFLPEAGRILLTRKLIAR